MGSLRPEAEGSPAPEVAEAASFERLLPDVLPHPLARSILAEKQSFGQGRHEQRSLADTD